MLQSSKNILFITLGWLALTLGIVGIFLPVLPTTPFAILAAYFFSKGSPKLHQKLLSSPKLGPVIREWEENGVIGIRAKWLATVMIILLFSYTLVYVDISNTIKIIVTSCGVGVLFFIWSRPSSKEIPESQALQKQL